MPRTTLADVFIQDVFESYQVEDSVEKTAFVESGAVVASAAFNELAQTSGRITTMPFWRPLDASTEPNYDNDVYTDVAEPQAVGTDEMIARIADLNEGFSSADLVIPISGKEPLKYVAAHIDGYWNQQFQRRVLATSIGIYNDNVAANGGDMVVNISISDGTVTDANRFSAEAVVNATLTLGDAMSKITGLAVHSVVYGRMLKLDLIDFVPDSEGKLTIPTYMGKTVIVDDGLPVLPGTGAAPKLQYVCILFGTGAFGYARGTPAKPSEFEREASRGNGGGFETLWSRKRWIIHPYGFSFTSTTITGPGYAPTWADLKLATNWERKLSRKHIPLAFLVVNG